MPEGNHNRPPNSPKLQDMNCERGQRLDLLEIATVIGVKVSAVLFGDGGVQTVVEVSKTDCICQFNSSLKRPSVVNKWP